MATPPPTLQGETSRPAYTGEPGGRYGKYPLLIGIVVAMIVASACVNVLAAAGWLGTIGVQLFLADSEVALAATAVYVIGFEMRREAREEAASQVRH